MKNRKIIFIILLALEIAYTYLAIKGKAHFFHGYTRDSFLLYILRYIVLASPALVHYIPGGRRQNIKESKKYAIPLAVFVAINLIIPMCLK